MEAFIVAALVALLLNFISDEIGAWTPWIAKRLVRYQASRLPRGSERVTEEWLANLNDRPGNVAKLWFAIDLWRTHRAIAAVAPAEEAPEPRIVSAIGTASGSSSVVGLASPNRPVVVAGTLKLSGALSAVKIPAGTTSVNEPLIPSTSQVFAPSIGFTGHAPTVYIDSFAGPQTGGSSSNGPSSPAPVFVDSPSVLSAGVMENLRVVDYRRRHSAHMSTVFETPLPLRVASSTGGAN